MKQKSITIKLQKQFKTLQPNYADLYKLIYYIVNNNYFIKIEYKTNKTKTNIQEVYNIVQIKQLRL